MASKKNLVTSSAIVALLMLTAGGLVAWSAGAFDRAPDARIAAQSQTNPVARYHGGMELPAGHPSPEEMRRAAETMRQGAEGQVPAGHPPMAGASKMPPLRPDAPSGACPGSAAARKQPVAHAAGDACCPEPTAATTETPVAATAKPDCCPEGMTAESCSGAECQPEACEKPGGCQKVGSKCDDCEKSSN